MARYMAIIVIDGKEGIVFPRSKKTQTFPSIESAERALEKYARHNTFDSRGLVKSTRTGEIVWTVAL